jgi:site-specific DNA recombinase
VDSKGREGETAKKDTHYAIREDQAHVVQKIYRWMQEGNSLRSIAERLNQKYSPPKRSAYWTSRLVWLIIKNPVYKGEYLANTWKQVKTPVNTNTASLTGGAVRTIIRKVPRPPEEWIKVAVPAIVSVQEWEMANKILAKNAKMSQRNGKDQYLLTGLVKCACCGRSYSGKRRLRPSKSGQLLKTTWYFCSSQGSGYPNAARGQIDCAQGNISGRILEEGVWSVVYQVLLHPQILLDVLEREFHGDRNEQVARQIAFLESQIETSKIEDEKLYKAYVAGVFNEVEYAGRRKMIKDNQQKLAAELRQLNDSLISPDRFEQQKQEILLICQQATANGLAHNAPFEVRRNIIKTIVEKIILNVDENWFELEGVIHGRYSLYEDPDSRPNPRRRNGRGRAN